MRYTFGGQAVDFLIEPPSVNARVLKSLTNQTGGTAWSAQTGGSQYTDLQPIGTDPAPITTDGEGRPRPFYGPDGIRDLWVSFGGARFLLRGREIGSDADVAGLLNNPASLAAQAVAATYGRKVSLVVDAAGGGDYSTLTAALAAVPAGGADVLVKRGTYTGAFVVPSNVTLRGEGDGTIIKAPNGASLNPLSTAN